MIQIDCVVNKIVKNKILRVSEKIMNKNTLLNSDIEKNIFNNSQENLQEEIMKICDVDNIFSFCEFETNELEFIKKLKEKIKLNKNSEDNIIYEEFVNKYIVEKYKIKLSDIKKKLQTIAFKNFYYECLKRQSVLDCNIKKSVEAGKILKELREEQNNLNKEYDECVVQLQNEQLDSLDSYEKVLQSFANKKQVDKSIDDILKKTSKVVLKTYLSRKIVYLISCNFDKSCLPHIKHSLGNCERFKNNFELVYKEVLEALACGNK